MKRILAVLIVVCILAVAGYVGAFYLTTPSPEEVLRRVGKTYAKAADYQASGSVSMGYNVMGMDMSMDGPVSVAYKRPNRIKMKAELGGMAGTQEQISDGESIYARTGSPAMGALSEIGSKWIKYDVPEKLSESEVLGSSAQYGNGIQELKLLEGEDPLKDVKSVTMEAGKPWKPVSHYVLDITFKDGGTQKLWIGKKDYLIHKEEWKPSMDLLGSMDELMKKAAGEEASDEAAQARKEMAETIGDAMTDMSIELDTEYDSVKVGVGLTDDEFALKLGEGEEITTMEDMMKELGLPPGGT